ncbi:hypothetical protein N008_20720 [Hymenobacter sp. APR13]|nr:hypothetical protein N008_20720 [Hymenobacter sp. APR13]
MAWRSRRKKSQLASHGATTRWWQQDRAPKS